MLETVVISLMAFQGLALVLLGFYSLYLKDKLEIERSKDPRITSMVKELEDVLLKEAEDRRDEVTDYDRLTFVIGNVEDIIYEYEYK